MPYPVSLRGRAINVPACTVISVKCEECCLARPLACGEFTL
jgi:hypothetical protein